MTTTSKFYNVTEEEHAVLSAEHGFTDKEFEMLHEGRHMIRAGEELVAMAHHDALHRLWPEGPPPTEEKEGK